MNHGMGKKKKIIDLKYIYKGIRSSDLFPQSGLLGIFPPLLQQSLEFYFLEMTKIFKSLDWKTLGKHEVGGATMKTGGLHGFVHSGCWTPFSVSPSQLLECWQSGFHPPSKIFMNVALWNPVSPWGKNNNIVTRNQEQNLMKQKATGTKMST